MRTQTFSVPNLRARLTLLAAIVGIVWWAILSGPALANAKYAGFVMDAHSGKVLYSSNADAKRHPASLTKMMTLYLVFEALESGKVTKATRIRFSKNAASKPPSKLGIRRGGTITVGQAILALVTKSANDVATAVAEHLGGSEAEFARMMTARARQLGMGSTTFRNASGLTAKGQLTTARDMARLGVALRQHFPNRYGTFSTRSFKYGRNRYANHNRLLGRVKGVDGIKTGYTRAAGFNLVSSVEQGRRSIVAVVMGGKSGKSRNAHMADLISRYLRRAGTGSRTYAIARAPVSTFGRVFALDLPRTGPVPVFRFDRNEPVHQRIAQAHVPQVVSSYAAASPRVDEVSQQAVRERLFEMAGKQVPVPTQSPSGASDPLTTAGVTPLVEVGSAADEPETSAPAPRQTPKAGWQIQIAAVPTAQSADALLAEARSKAGDVLSGTDNYLETVIKDGVTLYRARFAGFVSKQSARSACSALKRKRFACLAIAG